MIKRITILLLAVFIVSGPQHRSAAKEMGSVCRKSSNTEHQVMDSITVETPKMVSVHFEKTYIDGIKIVKETREHFISPENILTKYPGWHLAKCNENKVFLSMKVDDLSPISKTAGIIGLKDGNILTLYNGKPSNQKVIQTFFQIDVNAMEADAAKRLNEGIRITNKNQYEWLLHSLSKYAVNHMSKVQRNS
ncbi:MAG: BofC C-terminal domain-containing protein [Tuberibacillus sp.]